MKAMDLKKHLRNIIFAAALMPGASMTVMAAPVHGNIDDIQDNSISGWAWDEETPQESLEVSAVISDSTGSVVGEAAAYADIQRDDVAACGFGSGACGFSIPVDWSQLPDGTYNVQVIANEQPVGVSQQYVKGQPRLRSLGVFKTTGYCPCRSCCGKWGLRTSTGAIPTANHTIAVDPRVIPYGTKLMINGIVYTAEDCGGGVNGNHIDIFFNTHGRARMQGVQYAEVFLVEA